MRFQGRFGPVGAPHFCLHADDHVLARCAPFAKIQLLLVGE
jgi:hypothetical protein